MDSIQHLPCWILSVKLDLKTTSPSNQVEMAVKSIDGYAGWQGGMRRWLDYPGCVTCFSAIICGVGPGGCYTKDGGNKSS